MQRSKLRLQTHTNEQCRKHGQPKRLRGLYSNYPVVLAWRLYRKFCRLLAPENVPDIAGRQRYEHMGMLCAKLTISAELKKASYLNERGRPSEQRQADV